MSNWSKDCGRFRQCGAEDDSGNCPCTYPIISIGTIDQDFAKQAFVRESIYQVEGGYVRIKSLKFYFSSGEQVLRQSSSQRDERVKWIRYRWTQESFQPRDP